MVTMAGRSMGLFIFPLNTSTGLGLVTNSLTMAVGQFVWGAVQPIAGAVAAFCNLPIREPEIEGYAVPAYLMGFRLAQESSSPSAKSHLVRES